MQRKPPSSEQRQADPRYPEPRQAERHHVEPRRVDSYTKESYSAAPGPRSTEQRPVDLRSVDPRHAASRPAEHHHFEARNVGSHNVQSRPVEHRPVERNPSELSTTESRLIEHRHIEPRPVDNRQFEAQNQAARMLAHLSHEDQRKVESTPTVPGKLAHDTRSIHQGDRVTEPPSFSLSRQESKRKAVESPEQVTDVFNPKRPRTGEMIAEEAVGQSPSKRSPRARPSSQDNLEARVERTIPFSEIYQDGKAQYKHKIFEYKAGSGNWYIVRCDGHGVHFGINNPVHGAAKHVHSPQHNNMEKRHDLAIEICGHRILGCNAELAEMNNREFERALKEDNYVVFNSNLLTKEGRRRLTGGPSQESPRDSSAATKKKPKPPPLKAIPDSNVPQECKFYQGLWRANKKWYMLIILPIRPDGSLTEVGLREKLQETDLMGNIPKCYRVDRVSLQIKGWQPAYEDGGPKVAKREYPVMFFDSYHKHSVGWLSAQRLRAVDLDNPPDDIEKRGLSIAREWYARQMMHRRNWDDLKRLGRGEPPSTNASTSNLDQWPSLRSAHTDEQSPIRDKSSGPGGHFDFGNSSEEGSDDEDPMTMDIGPIPEPEDSNYVAESGRDDSDVDMDGTRDSSGRENATRPTRRSSQISSSRPSSRRARDAGAKVVPVEVTGERWQQEASNGPSAPHAVTGSDHPESISAVLSDQEHLRKSAQAKAAAAVIEAASRSRASSEVPDNVGESHMRPRYPPRPSMADHSRSRSEDFARSLVGGAQSAEEPSKSIDVRKPSDLHSILNAERVTAQPESKDEQHADPYKRFEAIKAQMNGLRSASAPIHEGNGAQSPFSPPPAQVGPAAKKPASAQPSPALSQMPSPQSRVAHAMSSRISSDIHVQTSDRSTPRITIPEGSHPEKKHDVQNGSAEAPPSTRSETPRALFATMPTSDATTNGHVRVETAERKLQSPKAQLGTPILDKRESFDVSQFRDTARGMRWSRDGPTTPFLRLNADPMRGWAETAGGAPLTAGIEPSKVARIEVETPAADRQKVQLTLKDGNEQIVMFETNSANGRSQSATLQGRKFVSWVKKLNEDVELHDAYSSGSPVPVS